MMDIKLHTVLTLDNNQKYVVVAKTEYMGVSYDYLLQLAPNGITLRNKAAIVKEEKENNSVYVIQVNDENLLKTLAPLFESQLA
ncbi:MAG: hypothetical protein HFH31_02540 [Bacilli bacterium]|nr:hypothetical protein [Bacilli bacterium]